MLCLAQSAVPRAPWWRGRRPEHHLEHDLRDEWAIPSLIYHRKGWLHTRIRDGTLSSPTLASSMTQIIFPIPVSVWLNYHNLAGKTTALQNKGIMAGEMPLSVHSTARAHSTASCQDSIPCARKAALIPAHTHKLQLLLWTTAFWVIYIKCWQVFREGKSTSVFANVNNWPDLVVCS